MNGKELKMEIDIKNIKAAYETVTESEKTLSDLSSGQTEKAPVTERIKTFEDARLALGESHPFVVEWRTGDNFTPDHGAYLKLRVICAALNEGWKPKFNREEYRYFPWFRIYTKEEYEELDKDEKKESRVVSRSSSHVHAIGGVSYANSNYGSAFVYTHFGSRLAFKTKELAEYCGKQFIDIWAEYLL